MMQTITSQNPVSGSTDTYALYTAPSGALGVAVWRLEDQSVPPIYRSTVSQKSIPNKVGTNVNAVLRSERPLYDTTAKSAVNKVIVETKLTALQNVVGHDVQVALKAHIDALIARADALAAGRTLDQTLAGPQG